MACAVLRESTERIEPIRRENWTPILLGELKGALRYADLVGSDVKDALEKLMALVEQRDPAKLPDITQFAVAA